MRAAFSIPSVALISVLLACGGTMGVSPVSHVSPKPQQRLYAADYGTSGQVRAYNLPLTASSTPYASFAFPFSISVAADGSGNLAGADNSQNLEVFTGPVTNSTNASASFTNGGTAGNSQIAYAPSGKLFTTSQSASVKIFAPPFSNSSTASGQVTDANIANSYGIAFDASGSLYLSGLMKLDVLPNEGASTPSVQMTYPSGAAVRDVALGNGTFAAANPGSGGTGNLLVYTLPLSNTSTPAATITQGINNPAGVAIDASGDIYVSNMGNSTISVYAPPFSNTSSPTLTLTVPSASLYGLFTGQ